MTFTNAILLVVLILGVFAKNNLLSISACSLLLLSFLKFETALIKIEELGLDIGIVVLTMGVLAPIALNKINREDFIVLIKSPEGILSLIAGLTVTILAGRGVIILKSSPQVILGILVGTIVGIGFFKGTPVGPLIGGGITAVALNLFNILFK